MLVYDLTKVGFDIVLKREDKAYNVGHMTKLWWSRYHLHGKDSAFWSTIFQSLVAIGLSEEEIKLNSCDLVYKSVT